MSDQAVPVPAWPVALAGMGPSRRDPAHHRRVLAPPQAAAGLREHGRRGDRHGRCGEDSGPGAL